MYLIRKPENPFSEKINDFEENMTADQIDRLVTPNMCKSVYLMHNGGVYFI